MRNRITAGTQLLYLKKHEELGWKAREYNRSKKMTWRDSSNGWWRLLAATLLTAVARWRGSVKISKKGKEK